MEMPYQRVRRFRGLLGPALLLAISLPAAAQQTVGLFLNESPQAGLTLFSPNASTRTYLINEDGLLVRSWSASARTGLMGYLLSGGHLLRAAQLEAPHPVFGNISGRSGRVEEYDWDGALVWEFEWSGAGHLSHHDFEPLPGGNLLMISLDQISQADAIAAGRDPSAAPPDGVWLESIIEVEPTPPLGGNIVWEWHARDHLIQEFDPTRENFGVVADHPERIDLNRDARQNYLHFNGIAFNESLDQILVSARSFSEVWVIDHSTTTAEAAGSTGGAHGKGGDLLYRWGNPQAYGRGTLADQSYVGQHDPTWVAGAAPGEWRVLAFSNGLDRPPNGDDYSTVEEIVLPLDAAGHYPTPAPGEAFGPAAASWTYQAEPASGFFSRNQGGAQRQPDGNTLICETTRGRFFEVAPDGTVVWEYVNPVNGMGPIDQGVIPSANGAFKVRRYPRDYPGFAGRDLDPGDPVEGFQAPEPVPAGSLLALRGAADGSAIDVLWDAATCTSFDYHLLYGPLGGVASYELDGAECGIGIGGAHPWINVPASDLYFLVVGTDDLGVYESSWGQDGAGVERNSTRAAARCGTTTKVISGSCP